MSCSSRRTLLIRFPFSATRRVTLESSSSQHIPTPIPVYPPTCSPFSILIKHPSLNQKQINASQTSSPVESTTTAQSTPSSATGLHRSMSSRVRHATLNQRVLTIPENVQTVYFRGRKLQGRRVAVPDGYRGKSATHAVPVCINLTLHCCCSRGCRNTNRPRRSAQKHQRR